MENSRAFSIASFRHEQRKYLKRPHGNCWVFNQISEEITKMVTRYGEEMVFCCEYDGKSLGDEFKTSNVNEAINWLYS